MNCFTISNKKIIDNFAKIFKEELKETLSEQELKNFNFSEPVYLSSDSIQKIIEQLNSDQQLFKYFLINFNNLTVGTKIKTLTHFCPMNSVVSEKYVRTVFPNNKKFKTPFIVGSQTQQFKSMANVYAKKGVNFNALKTYKPEEIVELLNSGKIVVSNFEPYGKTYYNKTPDFIDYELNMLNLQCNPNATTKDSRLIYTTNNKQIIKTLLESVDLTKLNNFYKHTYLSTYKNCLRYLHKCTEFSTQQENVNLKKMQEEIETFPQRIEQNKNSKTEIEKLISDTGRE